MFKKCVICGRQLFVFVGDFCKNCDKYKDAEWAIELARIEKHNKYVAVERVKFGDCCFTDANLNQNGEKIIEKTR